MGRIVCVGLDGFLVDLVDHLTPKHDVTVADGRLDDVLRLGPQAVVVAAGDPMAEPLARSRLASKTIAVVDAGQSAVGTDHVGPVLIRPVTPEDLTAALARVIPASRRDRWRRALARLPEAATADGVFAAARIAAVAAAVALELSAVSGDRPWTWMWVAIGLAVARLWVRGLQPALVLVDAVVAGGVLYAAGGPRSSFLLLATVVTSEIGYAVQPPSGGLAVLALTVGGVAWQLPEVARGSLEVVEVVAWGSLVALAGLSGVLARRISLAARPSSRDRLAELQETLERLLRQSQGVVGALETTTVADEVLESARADFRALAGIVLVGEPPVRSVAATFGLVDAAPPRIVVDDASDEVPDRLAELLPSGRSYALPIRAAGVELGQLIAVVPDALAGRQTLVALRELADEAGLALDNVRLFTRVREMSVDRERQRLARDLHDGVIQTLVHVGFELDLLARTSGEDEHVRALRDTVGRTVDEVRATVNDLRSAHLSAGIGAALHSLGRDMKVTGGPDILVHTDPLPPLAPEAELQLMRIAQEALSNALQHAEATRVEVGLTEFSERVRLTVRDNGSGLDDRRTAGEGRGVGLRAMAERARLLGGELTVQPGPHGGTVVQLEVAISRVGE